MLCVVCEDTETQRGEKICKCGKLWNLADIWMRITKRCEERLEECGAIIALTPVGCLVGIVQC